MPDARPEVIFEVLFEEGNLFLALRNIGARPALSVRTQLKPAFKGLGGAEDYTRMPVFRNIEFLGPGREIRMLLDAAGAYFARDEPTAIAAVLTYADDAGQKYETRVRHDLEIYRSLPYLVR